VVLDSLLIYFYLQLYYLVTLLLFSSRFSFALLAQNYLIEKSKAKQSKKVYKLRQEQFAVYTCVHQLS